MKILLLDDNADTVTSLKLILERRGFEVEGCLRAVECLLSQARAPAAVLITDLFMPDVEGLQIIQTFRERWPQTRIIAISGGGATIGGDYLAVAEEIGADLSLRKPVDPEALLDVLAAFARPTASD